MSWQWGKVSVRFTWSAAFRPEGGERVVSLDPTLVEVVRPARAEHHGVVLLRADEHEADARIGAQALDELRGSSGSAVPVLRDPGCAGTTRGRARPRAVHRHLGRTYLTLLLLPAPLAPRLVARSSRLDRAVGLRAPPVTPRVTVPTTPLALPTSAHGGVEVAGPARPGASTYVGYDQGRDEVGQRAVVVPLLERRALRLAVVGEHDDVVRPGRIVCSSREPTRGAVDLCQLLERLRPFDAAMVGDLVVAEEHRVDHRPSAVRVLDRGGDLELPLQHVSCSSAANGWGTSPCGHVA